MGLPCEDAADAAPSSGEATPTQQQQQQQQQPQAPPSEPGSPGGSAERRWYCLVKVDPAGAATAATEEDAEALAGLLTPQQALAARSPALSVEEAADSPEHSASTSRPPPPAAKPGGPCDHCGTSGALSVANALAGSRSEAVKGSLRRARAPTPRSARRASRRP